MRLLILLCIVGCTGVQNDPQLAHARADAGCDAPDGPLHPYTHATELEQLIPGRWIHCSGPSLLSHGGDGIELLGDHTYYGLVGDAAGNLVRKDGFDWQGSWAALQLSPSDVEFSYTEGEGNLALEDEPTRFALPVDTEGNKSVYALLP